MHSLIKIFQQTSWQILGKIVTSVSTFIILGLVARNYGEGGVGIYTLALTYLAMFYLLSDLGFNAHVLRKFQIVFQTSFGRTNFKLQIEWQKLLGTRLIWSAVLVAFAIGLLPFWPFATAQFSQAVLFGSLAIMGSAVFVTCNLVFQSKLRYDLSVLASSVGTTISLGLFFYLSFFKYPVSFLLLAHLVGWIIIAAGSIIFIKRFLPSILPIYDIQYTKYLFKDSWPIGVTLLLNVVYFRADAFLVAFYKGLSDSGIYNLSFAVFQSVLVLPTFIMNAYYPMMLKSFKGIKLVGLGLFLLASLGTVLTFLLAPAIIRLLTGDGFSGSVQSLQILSLGFPPYFLSALLMWVLVSRGKYKTLLIIYTLGLIVNLILNFILIPQFSFYAAATTTVVSEYLILVLLLVSLRV